MSFSSIFYTLDYLFAFAIMSVPVEHSPLTSPQAPAEQSPDQSLLEQHQASLFRPATKHVTARDIQLPDSFFEPTSAELANAASLLTNRTENLQNATLKTKKMRDAETQKRMSRFPKVLIRILLPDRIGLQGIFTPKTTIRQLTNFVAAALNKENTPSFYLFVVPPKRKLSNMNATLWDESLVPAAIIHLGVDGEFTSSAQIIKPEIFAKMTDAPETVNDVKEPEKDSAEHVEVLNNESGKSTSKSTMKPKIPKWFKK